MTQTGPPGFPDGPAESWKVHGRSDAPSPIMPRISSCQQRAQHPGVLLVQLHAGGQQVGGGLVVGLVGRREDLAAGAHHGFLAFHQVLDHLVGRLGVVAVLDTREFSELGLA